MKDNEAHRRVRQKVKNMRSQQIRKPLAKMTKSGNQNDKKTKGNTIYVPNR